MGKFGNLIVNHKVRENTAANQDSVTLIMYLSLECREA